MVATLPPAPWVGRILGAMRVFLTGARGQLGRALQTALQHQTVITGDRPAFDLTDGARVRAAILAARPDIVIHAAAHTDVDGCERDPALAYRVNALGTRYVAAACQEVGAALVYLSTDYVFDGQAQTPYHEFARPNPINVYGASKLAGEQAVMAMVPRHYIVRTAWVYGAPDRRSFVNTILRLAREREVLEVVTDEVSTPTYAPDLARAIARLIEQPFYGVYHLVNEGYCSRYDLAGAVVRLAGLAATIRPITTAEFQARSPLPARRPAFSALQNFCAAELGIRLRPWPDALAEYLCSLR